MRKAVARTAADTRLDIPRIQKQEYTLSGLEQRYVLPSFGDMIQASQDGGRIHDRRCALIAPKFGWEVAEAHATRACCRYALVICASATSCVQTDLNRVADRTLGSVQVQIVCGRHDRAHP